jgi:glucokinase
MTEAGTMLAGDIGGTNTRLGFFSLAQARLALEAEATYPSRKHESLDAVVQKFTAPSTAIR